MYATNLKGITVFRKRLYRLDASSVIREKVEGDKTRPPFERVYYPPCQELLEFLYKNNVKGVFKVNDESKKLEAAKNDEIVVNLHQQNLLNAEFDKAENTELPKDNNFQKNQNLDDIKNLETKNNSRRGDKRKIGQVRPPRRRKQ